MITEEEQNKLDEQEIVDDIISGVKKWDLESTTKTYIFFCDPTLAEQVRSRLERTYDLQVKGVAMYGWGQAEFSVNRRYY